MILERSCIVGLIIAVLGIVVLVGLVISGHAPHIGLTVLLVGAAVSMAALVGMMVRDLL